MSDFDLDMDLLYSICDDWSFKDIVEAMARDEPEMFEELRLAILETLPK